MGFTDDRRQIWAGGLAGSEIYVFDIATDPGKPKLVKTMRFPMKDLVRCRLALWGDQVGLADVAHLAPTCVGVWRSRRKRNVSLGRVPNFGSRRIGCFTSNCGRHRCAIVARISVPSIVAKPSPIHTRGPPPNGK